METKELDRGNVNDNAGIRRSGWRAVGTHSDCLHDPSGGAQSAAAAVCLGCDCFLAVGCVVWDLWQGMASLPYFFPINK